MQIARRWAARGIRTLRLDLEGIGDSNGAARQPIELEELYAPEKVDQVQAAVDALHASSPASSFLLVGLCSGAYWAFHAAMRDDRVSAAFMLNPRALFWDRSLEARRDFRRGLLRPSRWSRIARGDLAAGERLGQLALWMGREAAASGARVLGRTPKHPRHLDDVLDDLRERDKHLLLAFSGNEPLHEELDSGGQLSRLSHWPNMTLETIVGNDHTLRPLASQEAALAALDRALDRRLRR